MNQGILDWQMQLYLQGINYSDFIRILLSSAQIIQPLVIEGDYSYFTDLKYGSNFALVGDAATFIDPIFSSGIYLAMNGSRLVSKAIHKILSSEEEWDTALAQAYAKIEGAYKMVFKLISFFYSVDTVNFAQMGLAADYIHKQHEDAMAVGHFLLAGDFFDRYDEYGKIIDILYKPSIYNAFKKLVLEQPKFIDTTCNMSLLDAFHNL